MKAAILGRPIGHSLSPDIFRELAKAAGRHLAYGKLEVPPARLGAAVRRLFRDGFIGFNVTLPHKLAVLRSLASLSPEAAAIGAVNAVRRGPSGWEGHNTDAAGFLDALSERGWRVRRRHAVVFGAGGAARAVGYALGSAGAAKVHFINRSPARAGVLAGELGRRFRRTAFAAAPSPAGRPTLWVNATPLGMRGFPAGPPLPGGWRPVRGSIAYDLVYRPAATPFLAEARRRGARTIGGLDMLVYQALRSWELWFGELGRAERLALKRRVAKSLEAKCR